MHLAKWSFHNDEGWDRENGPQPNPPARPLPRTSVHNSSQYPLTIPHDILEPIGDESCPTLANVNVPLLRNKHCFMAGIDLFYVDK